MDLNVRIILPSNLRSGYLQSDFIASGLAYTSNKFSLDPDINENENQIKLKFELRDGQTREKVTLKRIKTLFLSNDPYFEPTATVTINDWPGITSDFDETLDYIWNLNSNYFLDNTNSKGSDGGTTAGSGYFIVNNWPLSANGGLSVVYLKAIIEGPGGLTAQYPSGYGVYDTIFWEGTIPSSPSNLNVLSFKTGWVGKDTKGYFSSSSSFSQESSDGIAGYLASLYQISSTGNTPDIKTTYNSTIYRSLCSTSSIAGTGATTYSFYRSGTATSYLGASYNVGSAIGLTTYLNTKGLYFYTISKLLNTTSKPDYAAQASFGFTFGSIGSTSSIFLGLYDSPGNQTNSDELILRVDLPLNSSPTSYLYTVQNQTESTPQQITVLPNSLTPMIKNGGLIELYYSGVGTNHAYVEGYFTPSTNSNSKSYLIANALVSSFGTTYLGAGFGYQIDGTNIHNSVTLNELLIAQGTNKLSVDLGDCSLKDSNELGTPLTKITNTWTTDQNSEYGLFDLLPYQLQLSYSIATSYIEIQKLDPSNEYNVPSIAEIQLFKPSISKSCSLEVKLRHRTDDFYIGFSQKSSYRPHNENGFTVNWDSPIGYRCLEDYSTDPSNAPSIIVKFSKEKNIINIIQRKDDGTFVKHSIKTYTPSDTDDRYIVELTDNSPSNIKGTINSTANNSTYLYVKKLNGQKLDLLGYVNLNLKQPLNENGLGYYAACGFIKSSFNNSSGTTYNRIYEIIFRNLSTVKIDDKNQFNGIKKFNLSVEALSNNKHYLGQKLLSGNTDFVEFAYENPNTTTSPRDISACSTGSNVNVSNLGAQTIDGVVLSSLANDSYILLKDQENYSENGVYKKTGPSTYVLQDTAYNAPQKIIGGDVNSKSTFYLTKIIKGSTVKDRFISTSYFAKLKINQISPFISSIRPSLLEFKLNFLNVLDDLDLEGVHLRFFQNTNDNPDYDNPLTDWISSNALYTESRFTYAPNSNLVQVQMEQSSGKSPNVSSGDEIWLLIALSANTSLGKAQGYEPNIDHIENGKFTYYKYAKNLWHKMFAYYEEKSTNSTHRENQHLRVRSQSHGFLESHSTDIEGPYKIDIQGPDDNGDVPKLEVDSVNEAITRSVSLTISAEDNDSGIMAFRVGKEIDNYRYQYTPWMPWSQFTVNNLNTYTIYLYGNLNYFNSGLGNSFMELQNIGFSGARKVWVQIMDYAGNVNETYPLTFAAQTWTLMDSEAPIGNIKFYDPKTFKATDQTNLISSFIKLNSEDVVSGVKDFKYRKIKDSGPDEWSNWEAASSYKNIDFTSESDGIKKLEVVFRDYGNNATQAENIWEKVTRPKK